MKQLRDTIYDWTLWLTLVLVSCIKTGDTAQMINVDNEFKRSANSDFSQGGQSMATEVASITTREMQIIDSPNTDLTMKVDIPREYEVDVHSFVERPFYVGSVTYSTSNPRNSLLSTPIQVLPGDVIRSNTSLVNVLKTAALGKPDLVLNISIAGTITHAGCILAAVLPPMSSYPVSANVETLKNTALSGPHAFLYANEATSVSLPVPWYCNTDLATLDMENTATSAVDFARINGNYGTLVFIVMNQLAPSTGSSTSLVITIEACFKKFYMAVPTPRSVVWNTQSKDNKYKGIRNPNYRYVDGDENNDHPSMHKHKKLSRIKIDPVTVAILSTVSSTLFLIIRSLLGTTEGSGDFVAQSLGSAVSGLFDTVAGGVKRFAGDAIDAGREWLRGLTGLHNPNEAQVENRIIVMDTNFTNNVDTTQYFEKLDPYCNFNRITREPLFGTDVDEMAISHITQKDQFIGTFTVTTSDVVGKRLWSRPISPFQGGYAITTGNTGRRCANNLELLHSLHRAWRGGLKLKIQSVMNNKQQVKLKVLKFYNPSINALSAYPDYASSANAPSHLLEFTQGGQMHEVHLPYLNRNELQACCNNMDTEAMTHGIYYIYVAQPLASSDGSPTSVQFNVYMSGCDDLTFYGYTTSNTYHGDFNLYIPPGASAPTAEAPMTSISSGPNQPMVMLPEDEQFYDEDGPAYTQATKQLAAKLKVDVSTLERLNKFRKSFHVVDGKVIGYSLQKEWKMQSGTVEVMNKPQHQDQMVRRDAESSNAAHLTRLLPSLDVRPLIRRMYKSLTQEVNLERDANTNLQIPLGAIVGELPWQWYYSPIETISRMYYGKNCGFKIRLVVRVRREDENSANTLAAFAARAYYLPQTWNALDNSSTIAPRTVVSAAVNAGAFGSFITPSSTGEVPLTASLISRDKESRSATYEFVIPNTSFLKFLGGPEKFKNFSGTATPVGLANIDFGSIVFQLINTGSKPVFLSVEAFVGLTDESRFGFHCIAPPFEVYKSSVSYYLGSNTNTVAQAPATLNPYVYYGGYS